MSRYPEWAHPTHWTAEQALRFLERERDGPFFLKVMEERLRSPTFSFAGEGVTGQRLKSTVLQSKFSLDVVANLPILLPVHKPARLPAQSI